MAVKLRFKRMGRKKAPVYKLVATDSRSKRDGRFIESLGLYNPLKNSEFTYNEERILFWLNSGATPTLTVHNLLSAEGILMKRLLVNRVGEEKAQEKLSAWKEQKAAAKSAKKPAVRLSKKAAAKAAKPAESTETAE